MMMRVRRAPFQTQTICRNRNAQPPLPSVNQHGLSFSGRLKLLSKKYGYSVIGVYFGLSVLDFPFCFLLVQTLGAEKIGFYEDRVIDYIHRATGWRKKKTEGMGGEQQEEGGSHRKASIWTELAITYGVHKSLIFIRLPITAAITPWVVKRLRMWGWNVGRAV